MENADGNPNTHEHWVGGHILEDVKLIVDLSGSNHVEDLKDNKHIEHNSEMSGWSIVGEEFVDFRSIEVSDHTVHNGFVIPLSPHFNWMLLGSDRSDTKSFVVSCVESTFNSLWEEFVSSEDNDEENDGLEDGHAHDVFDHFSGNDIFIFPVWWSLEKFIFWFLSGESERGKRVHNHVNPKELNGSKWRFPKDASSREGRGKSDNIN